jgi:membrane-bound lytic murein transglycosylase
MKKNVVYKTVSAKNLAGWVVGRESRVKDCLQQSKMFLFFGHQKLSRRQIGGRK